MPEDRPSPERVRAAMEELLGWQGISRSPQLALLLRYVVDKTLAGNEAAIKAYSIAVDVFGRPPTFDPQTDPIVRVQARRLRTLLEQYYQTGASRRDVEIHLPLGRYVPEFVAVEVTRPGAVASMDDDSEALRPTPPRSNYRRLFVTALIGLCFTLIGVALAIGLIRWMLPQPGLTGMPDYPAVSIGAFNNLTGEAVLDDDVAEVGLRLAEALGQFDSLSVVDAGGATVTGVVQEQSGRFVISAILTPLAGTGIAWSATINAPKGETDTDALKAATLSLAAQLASVTGPLHAPGRAWLKQQAAMPAEPDSYVCLLQFMAWRDTRELADADSGASCVESLLKKSPDDAVGIAVGAAMRSWRIQYFALPGDDVRAPLSAEGAEAARAVSLRPQSSFVHEQQALVFVRQGAAGAAIDAAQIALDLNPASTDAMSVLGVLRWLDGQYEIGNAMSERAITEISSPPPWYYMTRAFDGLREQRYFDAIDAGLALAQGDDELGPIVILAAASRVGRNDLIDRYRPMVLGNRHFQTAGIMPRLTSLFQPKDLGDRIRDGLKLAGIPPAALDGPFNGDGTPKS